jgi:hypothetical protein
MPVLARMRYTIEYTEDRDGAERRATVPMVFRDKQDALDGAAALMRTGIVVSKVDGPGLRMHRTALVAYCQARERKR